MYFTFNSLVVVQVKILISYNSGDSGYSPPVYRTASSVTLTCVAPGLTGSLSYCWRSTCSNCFASNSYSQTLSKNILVHRDAGNHTCTVSNNYGISGYNTTEMRINGTFKRMYFFLNMQFIFIMHSCMYCYKMSFVTFRYRHVCIL